MPRDTVALPMNSVPLITDVKAAMVNVPKTKIPVPKLKRSYQWMVKKKINSNVKKTMTV